MNAASKMVTVESDGTVSAQLKNLEDIEEEITIVVYPTDANIKLVPGTTTVFKCGTCQRGVYTAPNTLKDMQRMKKFRLCCVDCLTKEFTCKK